MRWRSCASPVKTRPDQGRLWQEVAVRALTRTVAESPAFSRAIVVVLVINAIALGCRTAESVSTSLDPLLIGIEAAVVAIFVAEMAIKITACRGSFFCRPCRRPARCSCCEPCGSCGRSG